MPSKTKLKTKIKGCIKHKALVASKNSMKWGLKIEAICKSYLEKLDKTASKICQICNPLDSFTSTQNSKIFSSYFLVTVQDCSSIIGVRYRSLRNSKERLLAARNSLISDISAGDGKNDILFLQCIERNQGSEPIVENLLKIPHQLKQPEWKLFFPLS